MRLVKRIGTGPNGEGIYEMARRDQPFPEAFQEVLAKLASFEEARETGTDNYPAELIPCPFCGKIRYLDVSIHQARRYGRYDAAIYCKKCYCYGPKIRSEDLALPGVDLRNEGITITFRDRLRLAAVRAWNRRAG